MITDVQNFNLRSNIIITEYKDNYEIILMNKSSDNLLFTYADTNICRKTHMIIYKR